MASPLKNDDDNKLIAEGVANLKPLGSEVPGLGTLADPGAVFVSNTVHDQVRDRLPFVFEDLGDQQVKNIARPVRVYRVRDLGAAVKRPSPPVPSARRRSTSITAPATRQAMWCSIT